MTKILVTGAKGMLGQDLCPILEDEGYDVIETDVQSLDITNSDIVEQMFDSETPEYVIHCAAYTNVDKAEEDIKTAELINVNGTENISRACAKRDIIPVFISTDYVFDGTSTKPYTTDDVPNPINVYGKTKLKGEEAIKKYCNKYYICRTSWLYGHHGKNFVETMLSLAQKQELKVVNDQIGCPTWTIDLANGIIKLIQEENYGVHHVCGSGQTSWYKFAKKIFELENLAANLIPCTTDEFPRPAKRPAYSVMNNNGLCRNWEFALKDYLKLRD